MRFAAPENFLLLILVVALGAFLFWAVAHRKKLLARFGDLPLLVRNAPWVSFTRQRSKAILATLALAFLVLTLSRLQFGTHLEMLEREGLDIVVAVDVSNSMLARDLKPDRLEKAKQEIQGIIDRLKGDRIGLVAFAGEAFIQCPLTLDYSAARFLLNAIDQHSVSIQGTDLSAALDIATRTFEQKERKHKVLLLLTDGEDHGGGIQEMAEDARRQGIKIYAVGIGNPAGEPIPVLDRNGNQVGFRKDESGDVIITRLDEATLQKVALTTGGKYYRATAGEMELDKIFEQIAGMEKKELEGALVTRYDDRYQWPLLIALILLAVEFFLSERKRRPQEVKGE